MVILLNTLYKKKTLLCRKQSSFAKPKKQPRNNELPYSKGLVIFTSPWQLLRHTHRRRPLHHTLSVLAVGASHIQQVAHNVLHIMYHVTIAKRWATVQESAILNLSNLSDHSPPPPVFNLCSKIAFLNKQVCLTSIMSHLLTLHPSYKLTLPPLVEPPPQLFSHT